MRDDDRPHVLILGGFLTEPMLYRALRARLLARDAASVTVAPIHVVDWMAAGMAGLGPLLVRSGVAIRRTHRLTGGRPLLVVGHSRGGVLARLALSPVAFDGRIAAVGDAVGCLVTLGTPHGLAAAPVRFRHGGVTAAAFLDRVAATTPPDPGTAIVTVGSVGVGALAWDRASWRDRLRNAPYRLVVGAVGERGGDGIVSVDLAHLPGAYQVTLPDATHGTFGARWYGDEAIIDRWWPFTVRRWREALAVRAARDAETGAPAGSTPGGQPAGMPSDVKGPGAAAVSSTGR